MLHHYRAHGQLPKREVVRSQGVEIADGSSQHAQQCVGADASAGHSHRLAFSSTCKGKKKKEQFHAREIAVP